MVLATKMWSVPLRSFSKCPLEGLRYVGVFHEVHEVGIEDAYKEHAETTCDGDRAVVCRIMLGAFFVEGGNVGFLPCFRELG